MIADTGKGIPPETLEMIFDLNFKTKDQRVGLGLGNACCAQHHSKTQRGCKCEK